MSDNEALIELLPCPFCGGTDSLLKHGFVRVDADHNFHYVECDCGAEMNAPSEYEAFLLWNKRPSPRANAGEVIQADREALAKLIYSWSPDMYWFGNERYPSPWKGNGVTTFKRQRCYKQANAILASLSPAMPAVAVDPDYLRTYGHARPGAPSPVMPDASQPSDLLARCDQARADALAAGEAPRIPYDWLVEIVAALRGTVMPAVAVESHKLKHWCAIELWFFRELSNEQRLALFGLCSMPVDEIGKMHGHQRMALKHVLNPSPPIPSPALPEGVGVGFDRAVAALRSWADGFTGGDKAMNLRLTAADLEHNKRTILAALRPDGDARGEKDCALCTCPPQVIERVKAGGTCSSGGCPYGGDF